MKKNQRRMMTMIIQVPAGAAAVEVDASPEDGALAVERASKEDHANLWSPVRNSNIFIRGLPLPSLMETTNGPLIW
jgi:hypothetical protein